MNKLVETYNLPRMSQEETNKQKNMNRSTTSNYTESVIKNSQQT